VVVAARFSRSRLGGVCRGRGVAMVILGAVGALLAAGRPKGFVNIPVPPLKFLVVPLADIALFGAFVALAILKRRDPPSHKRYMLLVQGPPPSVVKRRPRMPHHELRLRTSAGNIASPG
jgi:hypothetical protein